MLRYGQGSGSCGKLPRVALAIALASMSCLQATPDASAATTNLRVMARIATFFRMQVEYQTAALTVTALDIARGYVEAPAATNFSIVTNTAGGFVIDFHPRSDIFRSAVISGLPGPVEIGADGGTALYNEAHGRTTSHRLSYRFMLRPDLQPGSYGWPLAISVRSA